MPESAFYKSGDVMKAIKSDLRRELMAVVSKSPMDSDTIYNTILNRGFDVKHKESVYKDLQFLVSTGLLDKYYDKSKKKILYKPNASQVAMDTDTLQVVVGSDLGGLTDNENMISKVENGEALKVIKALASPTRRFLLKLLYENPMDAGSISNIAKEQGIDLASRDAVYKSLVALVDTNLVDKFYDKELFRIAYKSNVDRIFIDINTMEVVLVKRNAKAS